jgi:uncharacterized protein (TIGR00661 family)
MGRIFISLSGDGRGHATRVRALAERLRERHSLVIHSSGQGYEFLARTYSGSDVQVRQIAGLRFGYGASGNVRIGRTLIGALEYMRRLPELVAVLQSSLAEEQPDLVISDFEPALPRAANRMGIPHISLNHQHFLLTYDLRSLPIWLRFHISYMSLVVRAYDSPAVARIVSSFYFPPLRPGMSNVTQIGVLLRDSVLKAEPVSGAHLLVYWRRQAPRSALHALTQLNREVHVYGLGHREPHGRVSFHVADEARFVADLASCSALICTAGNQLVGEAIYLGKPVLAIPEPGNYEQYINAHFVGRMNAGTWIAPRQFTSERLSQFLDRAGSFRSTVPASRMDGLPTALAVLHPFLDGTIGAAKPTHPDPEPIPA